MNTKWDWLRTQPEGQFLERKGQMPIKEAADKIAETLAAMANAEGGTVVFGIEDDGTVSGVPERYDLEQFTKQIADHIRGSLSFRAEKVFLEGKQVWVFQVDWCMDVYQLSDGRYLYRHNDKNLPFPAQSIEAIKQSRRQLLTEAQIVQGATLNDLDIPLLLEVGEKAGLPQEPIPLLKHYRLAEQRNGQIVLNLACLLLFGKEPQRWHPRCGVDFAIWRGNERKTGDEFNIVKRFRIEGFPLPRLIQEAHEKIRDHLPERQSLTNLFFEESLIYPNFVWQEALVNAVAHRDYGIRGVGIEVDLFDDHIEIRSPGELVEPVNLERLRKRERVHASRNPLITRVLTDYGYMRERGEGIPRMFEVMEREGLRPPEFVVEAGAMFTVILYSTPIYPTETLRWLKQFEQYNLSPNQRRLLAYAHSHGGQFTNYSYRKLVGIDLYTATKDIKDLIRKGIVQLTQKRGRVYKLLPRPETASSLIPDELRRCITHLPQEGYLTNEMVRRILGVNRVKAARLLREWVSSGFLEKRGRKRWTRYYVLPIAYESLSSNTIHRGSDS